VLIHEIMTRTVRTCRPDDTLDVAAKNMWDGDIGCVPVLDDLGGVVGVITDRDACMAAYTRNRKLSEIRVRDIMAAKVVSCAPDTTVEAAAAKMATHQIHRMPVVENGTLVGMLGLSDVVLHVNDVSPCAADIVAALAAIRRPRKRVTVDRAA
jgi:CBS domain-containing protein